eukprot:jgi/Tetstr1/430316/TSEL_020141.t1
MEGAAQRPSGQADAVRQRKAAPGAAPDYVPPPPARPPVGTPGAGRSALQILLEGCSNQLARLLFASSALAWLLTRTSASLAWNFPLAAMLVGVAFWASTQWRKSVNAPIVESAWEKFLGNIIQEFLYDSFWQRVTPDSEFPAEVRRMSNHIFGCLVARARKIDVRAMLLRDMSDLMIEIIELFRDTQDSVGLKELDAMNPLARDRALRQEMKADGNLHPALFSSKQHYEVLKRLADGALALLLDPKDYARPAIQVIFRELFASTILKPAIQMLMPAYLNKQLVALLESSLTEVDASAAAALQEGEQALEQRAAASAEAERGKGSAQVNMKKLYLAKQASAAGKLAAAADQLSGQQPKEARPRAKGASATPSSKGEAGAAAPAPRSNAPGGADVVSTEANPREHGKHAGDSTASEAIPPPVAPASSSRGTGAKGGRGISSASGGTHRHLGPEATKFDGTPYTKVVAAEINGERRSREYVVFNIRVHDNTHEWTVLRRFRNFEQLHKQLRNTYKYGGSLPPKRYIFASHKWEFVEERREQLDVYLKDIIHKSLGTSPEVFEFLNPWSSAYALETEVPLINVVANNLDNARHSLKSKVAGAGGRAVAQEASAHGQDVLPLTEAASTTGAALASSAKQFRGEGLAREAGAPLSPARLLAEAPALLRSSSDSALGSPPTAGALPQQRTKPAADEGSAAQGGRGADDGQPPSLAGEALLQSLKKMGDPNFEEDSIGISQPLYLLVDAVFELQSHGFIWRQVTVVVKQMLSLVAGGTVDLLVARKMNDISSPHTWARLIMRLRNLLWPGGVFFTTARAAPYVARGEAPPSSVPPGGYNRDNWITLETEMGPEEVAAADKLKDIIFNQAPPSLVRIVGRSRYSSAAKDIYHILQSPTFMTQLGHGVLEILLLHLMPELKPLLEDIRSSKFD